jgi:hypothetical protein
MFQECQLGFTSYKPLSLEKGMLFLLRLHEGTPKEHYEVYKLGRVPLEQDSYIVRHGFPVNLIAVNGEGEIVATPEQLAWFDRGEDSDVLSDLEVEQINIILNKYDGYLLVDDELYEGKVTVRFLDDEEEFDDDYEDDDENLCYVCNGTGEGKYSDSQCLTCYGEGRIRDERDEGDVPEYDDEDN